MIPPIEMGEVGPPWFDEKPTVLIGQGLSLKGFDFNRLRGKAHVVAIKATMFELPWADCGTGIDFPQLLEWVHDLEAVTMPVYWAVMPHLWQDAQRRAKMKKPNSVVFLDKQDGFRISTDPKTIYCGGTSGFGALGLAVLKRVKRFPVYMFGFDYHAQAASNYHWAENRYHTKRPQDPTHWNNWARDYAQVAPTLTSMGIKVINASPESKITAFEKMTVEQAMQCIEAGQ